LQRRFRRKGPDFPRQFQAPEKSLSAELREADASLLLVGTFNRTSVHDNGVRKNAHPNLIGLKPGHSDPNFELGVFFNQFRGRREDQRAFGVEPIFSVVAMQATTRQKTLEGTPANFSVESVYLLFEQQDTFSFRLDSVDLNL
jgi:hypothetical protein